LQRIGTSPLSLVSAGTAEIIAQLAEARQKPPQPGENAVSDLRLQVKAAQAGR
jgi:hypothetical protein